MDYFSFKKKGEISLKEKDKIKQKKYLMKLKKVKFIKRF